MRWRKSKNDGGQSDSLFGDVLTDVAKHPGRPSAVSSWQAQRDLYSPRFAYVQYYYDGGTATSRNAYVPATEPDQRKSRIASGSGIGWNGELLTVMASTGHVDSWTPRAGGVLPEFRGNPERRPSFGFGFGFDRGRGGSDRVAEIAAVASPMYVFWLLFLNERSEQVADIPVAGFDEPRLVGLADAAGLHYRRYLLEVDVRTIPLLQSSEYFPGVPRPIDGSRTLIELEQWVGRRSSL